MKELKIVTSIALKDAISFAFYHYYRTTAGIMPAILCLCVIMYFLFLYSGHTDDFSLLYSASFVMLIYLIVPGAIYFRAKKSFLSSKRFSEPISWQIDAEHLKATGAGFESQLSWAMVTKVVENSSSFLIYHSNYTANIIPKRNLSDADIDGFQSLIMNIPGLNAELWVLAPNEAGDALRPASRWLRFWNFCLDSLCFLALYITLTLLYVVIYVYVTPPNVDAPAIVTVLPYLFVVPFYVLYYFGFEYLIQRSPAKFITRTKLITTGDKPLSRKQIFRRSLTRLIPFEGLSFLISSEGIHDVFSRTRVVRVSRTKGGKSFPANYSE